MNRKTVFSTDRIYRYTLFRQWEVPLFDHKPGLVNFLMLNPSTADETQDDPTIIRCIGFAKYWGFSELCVTNIFAYRATEPKVMKNQVDPVGPDNDRWIENIATGAAMIVTAWGKHGSHRSRDMTVLENLLKYCADKTYYLKKTGAGEPCHPLYLPADLEPQKWS